MPNHLFGELTIIFALFTVYPIVHHIFTQIISQFIPVSLKASPAQAKGVNDSLRRWSHEYVTSHGILPAPQIGGLLVDNIIEILYACKWNRWSAQRLYTDRDYVQLLWKQGHQHNGDQAALQPSHDETQSVVADWRHLCLGDVGIVMSSFGSPPMYSY